MRYQVGDLVDGRDEIGAVLGAGGMGEVYRARDATKGQEVVLKLPHVLVGGDLAAFNRYQREIEIAARLDHPGMQRLLLEGRSAPAGKPYMVLEYVEGESLRSYLRSHGPLGVEEVLNIVGQFTDVLGYIHAEGVVHRDLKPENILITADGRVKLADFGIALRLASRRLTFNHLTNAVGTPDYMAPEQVRGERGDPRTDIYALGVLLYELLTGRVPYPAEDALEAMRRKVETDPPLVGRLRPDLPRGIEAVIYRALRRKALERYSSIGELARDLANLDEVAIPVYRPDEPPPRPLGDLPPARVAVPLGVAVVTVLAAVGFLAEWLHRAQIAR